MLTWVVLTDIFFYIRNSVHKKYSRYYSQMPCVKVHMYVFNGYKANIPLKNYLYVVFKLVFLMSL